MSLETLVEEEVQIDVDRALLLEHASPELCKRLARHVQQLQQELEEARDDVCRAQERLREGWQ